MAALVEVHYRAELEAVLAVRPALVGINNRDLRDFTVRLETTLELRPLVPPAICLVAESGIHTPADVARLAEAGVDAILVAKRWLPPRMSPRRQVAPEPWQETRPWKETAGRERSMEAKR